MSPDVPTPLSMSDILPVPRVRLGTIQPAHIRVRYGHGHEFYRLVPSDVVQIDTVLGITSYTPEGVTTALENLWDCVDELARNHVDHILIAAVPVSARIGRRRMREICETVSDRTGIPCSGSLDAVVHAAQSLGLTKLAVGSRFDDSLNQDVRAYLEDGELQVVGMTSRAQQFEQAHGMTLDEGLQASRDVAIEAATSWPDADIIYLPGGITLSLPAAAAVEALFQKPALTNMIAEVWHCLIAPGLVEPLAHAGAVLSSRRV